jgi:hypothetical protein
MFFAFRVWTVGAKPARLITSIRFSKLPSFPVSDFQIFSLRIYTKVSSYFLL